MGRKWERKGAWVKKTPEVKKGQQGSESLYHFNRQINEEIYHLLLSLSPRKTNAPKYIPIPRSEYSVVCMLFFCVCLFLYAFIFISSKLFVLMCCVYLCVCVFACVCEFVCVDVCVCLCCIYQCVFVCVEEKKKIRKDLCMAIRLNGWKY